MWLRRILPLSVFLFIQLLVLADVLNRIDEDELLDVQWAGVFAPLIIYLAIGLVFVCSSFFNAGYYSMKTSSDASDGAYQGDINAVDMSLRWRRRAKIFFFDAIIDTIMLVLWAVFLGLLIAQLEADEMSWATVFIPLYILLPLLLIMFAVLALRVNAEQHFQRPLGNADCCAATLGGVVCCCKVDESRLDYANQLRQDKRVEYTASSLYHDLPCAFMCTPAMSYGCAEPALGWFWYLTILAALISLLLLTGRLDGTNGKPTIAVVFIPLWITEGLLFIGATFLVGSLCCCYRTQMSRPPGRASLLAKYSEGVLVMIASALLIVQEILIAMRIDDPDDLRDWNLIFLPAYVLFRKSVV